MRPLALILIALLASIAGPARADTLVEPGHHGTRLSSTTTFGSQMGAVEGALPSKDHPRGTVYLAWSLRGRGPSISEWDLAHERVVRQVSLGWGEGEVRISRAGAELHVLVTHDDLRVGYARVDAATLRVACRAELGRGALVDVSGDETLGAVAWFEAGGLNDYGPQPLRLALLDASCAMTRAVGPLESGSGSPERTRIAVLAGRAYVVVGHGPSVRVLAIARSGAVENQLPLPPTDRDVSIVAASQRLLVVSSDEILEVTPGLVVTARHPSAGHSSPLLSAARDGRLLSSSGDILSSAFTVQRTFHPFAMWVHGVTWVGDVAVVLSTAVEPSDRAYLDWFEPPP